MGSPADGGGLTAGGAPAPIPDKLEMARLEVALLDNDPDFPERGVIKFEMRGGR